MDDYVVKVSVTFHGRAHTIFTFVNFEDVPLTLDGSIVVTFGMPPCPQNNPICLCHLGCEDIMKMQN